MATNMTRQVPGLPGTTAIPTPAIQPLPMSVKITEAMNGKTITVRKGQDAVVELPSNPSTGYKWMVTSTNRSLGYPTTQYVSGSSAIGSGGVEQLTWKTKSPFLSGGTHHVTLSYARPWESDAPAKTFNFSLKIV